MGMICVVCVTLCASFVAVLLRRRGGMCVRGRGLCIEGQCLVPSLSESPLWSGWSIGLEEEEACARG